MMEMKFLKSGNYVVYEGKSYIYRVHETFIKIYGDETDNFESYTFDHEIVETSVGLKKINYDEPVTIYKKNISLSEISDTYSLDYEAIYQGERFRLRLDPETPIVTLVANFSQSKKFPDFKIREQGIYEKDIDISEVEIIPVKKI